MNNESFVALAKAVEKSVNEGPKPLFGDDVVTDTVAPPPKKLDGPKPLDFGSAPTVVITDGHSTKSLFNADAEAKALKYKQKQEADRKAKMRAVEEYEAEQLEEQKMKQLEEVEKYKLDAAMNDLKQALHTDKKVRPLDFGSAPTVQSKVVPNPGSIIAEKVSPLVPTAISIARTKFASLGLGLDSVERQLKQLLPLTITTVVSWGEPGISQESALMTQAAGLLRMFSELKANETVERALQAITAPPKTGFFQKMLSGGTPSVLSYKPNLAVIKTEMLSMMPQVDEFISKIDSAHIRVNVNLAALSSAAEATGTIDDSSLDVAVNERRRILTQCAQQCDLTVQQLKQAKTLMVEQLSRAGQLLDVTIPAFETANAVK